MSRMTHTYEPRISDNPSGTLTIAEDHGPGDTVELRLWHLEN